MLYMFDFDGTIVNSKGITRKTIVKFLNENDIKFDEEEMFNKVFNSFEDMMSSFHERYFPAITLEKFYDNVNVGTISEYVLLKPKEYFLEYLSTLEGKVIIATRNDQRVIDAWLKASNLDIEVIAEEKINVRKDTIEFYDVMANMFNVEKSEMVLFEDNAKNIEAANKAGVKAVGLFAEQNEERLEMIKENSVIVINDYDELIGKNIV
ncbi:MAG: HAD-IA family hydrolase [bacterium]